MGTVLGAGLLAGGFAGHASAAYVNTTGDTTGITVFQNANTAPGANTGVATVTNGADTFLGVSAEKEGLPSNQLRFIAGPTGVEGAEIALPTGNLAEPVRTEARFSIVLEGRTSADGTTDENPFVAFGLADFDSATNTANYGDKLIVQLNNLGTQLTLNTGINSGTGAGTTRATYPFAGGFTFGSTLELQLTGDQARLLLDGTPLIPTETNTDGWVPVVVDLTAYDGDTLLPFVGLIRGTVLEDADVVTAGFDDLNAQNVAVPEPASVGVLALASLALASRGRRQRH